MLLLMNCGQKIRCISPCPTRVVVMDGHTMLGIPSTTRQESTNMEAQAMLGIESTIKHKFTNMYTTVV